MMIIFLIMILLYANIIRYVDLKENTTMFTFKQYMLNYDGLIFSICIILLSIMMYISEKNL